ncbi:hypothetical protein MBANPS3_009626 [Mucor bainieri]
MVAKDKQPARKELVINHVESIHGYKLPSRQVGHKRPQDPHYEYNNNPESDDDYDTSHYACSSCWFHCPEAGLKELSDHVNRVHRPKNVNPEKNDNGLIKGGEVTDSDITNELNQKKHDANKAEGIENDSDEEKDGEDEIMADTDDKKEKKGDPKDIGDIYQKLNELIDMFQRVLKGSNDKA